MIKSPNDFLAVSVTAATRKHFGDSVGLFGSFGDGGMRARDGETILENATDYGEEWQVRPDHDPLLFETARAPQYPKEQCRLPGRGKLHAIPWW